MELINEFSAVPWARLQANVTTLRSPAAGRNIVIIYLHLHLFRSKKQ